MSGVRIYSSRFHPSFNSIFINFQGRVVSCPVFRRDLSATHIGDPFSLAFPQADLSCSYILYPFGNFVNSFLFFALIIFRLGVNKVAPIKVTALKSSNNDLCRCNIGSNRYVVTITHIYKIL